MFRIWYIAGWVLTASVIVMLGVSRKSSNDWLALGGALGYAVAGILALGWYGLLARCPQQTTPDQSGRLKRWRAELYWLLVALNSIFPGLWIGATAHLPFWVAGAYALTYAGALSARPIVHALLRRLDPHSSGDSAPRRLLPEIVLMHAALLLLATAAGRWLSLAVRL